MSVMISSRRRLLLLPSWPDRQVSVARPMSMFESNWAKAKAKKAAVKYKGRVRPLAPDHDKDMPGISIGN